MSEPWERMAILSPGEGEEGKEEEEKRGKRGRDKEKERGRDKRDRDRERGTEREKKVC